MKISTKGRYGLRAMIDLAANSENYAAVSLKNIAKRQGISESYLERLVASLKKSGLVKSVRGAGGGYVLCFTTKEITVGQILRSLEGELAPVDCVTKNPTTPCDLNCDCVTKFVWQKIADSTNQIVDSISLEDLLIEQERLHC